MAQVVEALQEEHRNIARLLQALEWQIDVFSNAGDPDYDVVTGVADYFLDFPDRCHHPKEDTIFARMRARRPDEAAIVSDLPDEHRALHEQALRFHESVRQLLNGDDFPREAVVAAARQFIEAERSHMRWEEEHFLPLASRILTPADWLEVEGELNQRPDPLFGGKVEEGFKKLSDRLLAWEAEDEREPSSSDG